jgi:hypothetical protein
MKSFTRTTIALALVASLAAVAACGDDGGTTITPDGMDMPPPPPPKGYRQVEHLARPGINEALLLSDAFLNGYNATAPSFAGVDQATLGMVVNEAKTVLKALYLGVCLLDGLLGADLKPAGKPCHAKGGAIFVENNPVTGVTLTQASKDNAQQYADAVFGLFIPDVMRVDTDLAVSGYANFCGAGGAQGLCGGRFLNDDVIDTTYFFLLAGYETAALPGGPGARVFDQVRALVSDGVNYSLVQAENSQNLVLPDATPNAAQGHPLLPKNAAGAFAFPYSAAPL